jgi:hypothetical protein
MPYRATLPVRSKRGAAHWLRKSLLHGETPCRSALLSHQMLNHLLPDDAILLARQFCDCLRDRINDVIGFIGIDFV